MASRNQNIGIWVMGILFLTGIALFNGYPLVTSDTGTYINSAFTFEVPRDRPIAYSLLISAASLKFSLWLPVIFQSALLMYLISQLVSHFVDKPMQGQLIQAGIIVFVTLFTSAGWYCGMIMPDIFTAIGGLAFLLFILEPDKKKLIFYGLVLIYAISTHASHLLIFTLLGVLTFIIDRKQRKYHPVKYIGILLISLSGWLFVPALHRAFGGKFTTNESTHVFLTGRFLETGTLQRYLDNECKNVPMALCNYRYELPSNAIGFIWSQESPLYKTNGWDDPNHEYRKMVRKILLSPKYNLQFLYASFFHSMTQLVQTDVGDGLTPHIAESNPFWKVQQYFPAELPTYLGSRQNTNRLSFSFPNQIYRWVTIISFLFLLWLLRNGRQSGLTYRDKQAILICIGFVVLNALVTATFGNVLARLQSRVIWLIPMVAAIMWTRYSGHIFSGARLLWKGDDEEETRKNPQQSGPG